MRPQGSPATGMADMTVCRVGIRELEPVSLAFSLTAVFRVVQSG
jgi:hypothetical protein